MIAFLLVVLFAVPNSLLDYQSDGGVGVHLDTTTQQMRACVQQGLELRYQFVVQLCRERTYWFDDCAKKRKGVSTLSFDPITGSFQVERDLYDDGKAPSQRSFAVATEAFPVAGSSMLFYPELLGLKKHEFAESNRLILRYRTGAYCKQHYNRTLDRIAQTLSLGFLGFERYDSGWNEVEIKKGRLPERVK